MPGFNQCIYVNGECNCLHPNSENSCDKRSSNITSQTGCHDSEGREVKEICCRSCGRRVVTTSQL